MTARQVIGLLCGALLVTCGNVVVFALPNIDATENARDKVRDVEDELLQLRHIADNRRMYEQLGLELADETRRLRSEIPDSVELEALSGTLRELASGTRVDLEIRVVREASSQFYREHTLALRARGSFLQLRLFLEGTERLRRLLTPRALRLSNPRPLNGLVVVDAELTFTIYSFVATRSSKHDEPPVAAGGAFLPRPPDWRDDDAREPRDPFDRVRDTHLLEPTRAIAGDECVRPPSRRVFHDARRARPTGPALRQVPLEDLHVVGVRIAGALSCALVLDGDDACHTVRLGETIGRDAGLISAIDEDTITVTRTFVEPASGRTFPVNVTMPVAPHGRLPPGFCPRR